MEKLFYEMKPALFLGLALYAIHQPQGIILKGCGWLLMASVLTILWARYTHRKATN